MRRTDKLKGYGLALLGVMSLAATTINSGIVEIEAALNARSNDANFYTGYRGNYLHFSVPAKTIGVVRKVDHLASGNLAYQIEIIKSPNGQHIHDQVWIYDDVRFHPNYLRVCLDSQCRRTTSDRSHVTAVRTQVPMPVVARTSPQLEAQTCITCHNQTADDAAGIANSATRALVNIQTQNESLYANNPAVGARKLMATIYQSCHVLDKAPYNWGRRVPPQDYNAFWNAVNGVREIGIRAGRTEDVDRHHYYMSDLETQPGCHDMSATPINYFYGGKPDATELKSGVIDLFDNRARGTRNAPSVGVDCSAFVSSAFLATGRRLAPGPHSPSFWTAADFLRGAGGRNSCFSRPTFTGTQTLQSGDVISFGHHVVIVDQVGNDPFGLNKRHPAWRPLERQDCYGELNKDDLNFTFIQSVGSNTTGPNSDNIGVARTTASSFLAGDRTKLLAIERLATQACLAAVSHRPMAEPYSPQFALIRHVGEANPSCMSQPMEVRGFQCLQGCFDQRLAKGLEW